MGKNPEIIGYAPRIALFVMKMTGQAALYDSLCHAYVIFHDYTHSASYMMKYG